MSKPAPFFLLKTRGLRFTLIIIAVVILSSLTLFWIFIVGPRLLAIPDNFQYSADVVSQDNFYDSKKDQFQGPETSVTKFFYTIESKKRDNFIIKNVFDVRRTTGEKIFTVERLYGIDPKTERHTKGLGDHDREGYLFAPRHVDKRDFIYWHVNYDGPALLKFKGREKLYGLNVHRFETDYHADQTENLSHLPGVGKERGINLDINLNLWIEPETGRLIKYQDKTTAYYYDLESGQRLHPWNSFTNTFSEESTKTQANLAKQAKERFQLTEKIVPGVLILAITILVLILFSPLKFLRSKPITRMMLVSIPILGLIITLTAVRYASKNNDNKVHARFEAETTIFENLILKRLEIYKNSLLAGSAFLTTSGPVSRDEWKEFISNLKILDNYPGIQGISFVEHIEGKTALREHIARQLASGQGTYSIYPAGDRLIYTPVVYLEPATEPNLKTIGFDLYSEEARRKTLELVRDSGFPQITSTVYLVQDQALGVKSPAFLMVFPIYDGKPQNTPSRQLAIRGYVTAPFRMNDFMRAVFEDRTPNFDFAILDGIDLSADSAKVFEYHSNQVSQRKNTKLTKTKTIYAVGHAWTITFAGPETFGTTQLEQLTPAAILISGLTLLALLSFLVYSFYSSHSRAVIYARQLTVDLRESKDKLVEAQKVAHLGSWEWDIPNDKVTWSDELYRIYGLKPHEFKVNYNSFLQFIHKDHREMIDEAIKSSFKRGKPFSFDHKIVRPDGAERWLRGQGEVVKNKKGRTIKMFGTAQDITEGKSVEVAKSEFVSLASHQLRNPPTLIKWYLESLLSDEVGKFNKRQKKYLEDLYQINQRATDLVNALLSVSRIEMGTFSLEPQKVNIAELCQSVSHDLQHQIKEKSLSVEENYAPNLPRINSDPKLISVIIQNLLMNSINYTQRKGKIQIVIQEHIKANKSKRRASPPSSGEILLRITDTGCGIPKAQQPKIFSKFFRADNAKYIDPNGNGLGLYIVKSLLEELGGRIWFESKEGIGTTFFIKLPQHANIKKKGTKVLT